MKKNKNRGYRKLRVWNDAVGFYARRVMSYIPFSGRVFIKRLFLDGFRRYSKMCSRRKNPVKSAKNYCFSCKKGLDMI